MKPQYLHEHLESVANLAGQFAGQVGLGTVGALLGLGHDIGKGTFPWLEYLNFENGLLDEVSFELKGRKLDHSTAGAQLLYEALRQIDGTTTLAADVLAMTAASHHGLMDALTPDGHDAFSKRLAKDELETGKDQALEYLPPAIKERLQELLREDIEKELKDFLRRSVEREKYGNSEVQFNLTLMVRFLLSCLMLIALMLPILKLTIIAKNDNWECTMIRQD
jgi:CRISPR-associated endonuclease/helicase Cas3